MLMDLHTHTHHSFDGMPQSVAERIARAEELGLRYMAVTDHVEINRFYPAAYYGAVETEVWNYDGQRAFEGSLAEVTAEKPNCTSLTLLCGAEIGQMTQCPDLAAKLYTDPRLDLVIGSVHELPRRPDFFFLDYEKEDIPALVTAYFDEVLRLAQMDTWDILAHLTYGLRYLPNRAEYDLTPHLPVIDEIFRTVIAKGKAIELNGSGLKNSPEYTDPALPLIRRYHDLGGRYLTLSTDAHDTKYLGFRMDALEDMARAAGFSALTVFRKHQPELIPLP